MTKANALSIVVILLLAVCAPALGQVETQYYAIFMKGKKVGHAIHTRRVEGYRVRTSDEMSIAVSRDGASLTTKVTTTSVETKAGKPLAFELVQLLGQKTVKVSGKVNGVGIVGMTTSSMGVEERSTTRWPEGTVMSEGLRLLALKNGLQTGTMYPAKVFDVETLRAGEVKVLIGETKDVDLRGRVMKLTKMVTITPDAGQILDVRYVDAQMHTFKRSMVAGGEALDIVACTKAAALRDNDVLDMVDMMVLDSPMSLDDLGSASAITYWIRPKPGALITIPTTDNQKAKRLPGGVIKLAVKPVGPPPGGVSHYRGNNPALREALKPTRFVQSDRKEIVALAREAVGRTTDPLKAARQIESFVARYIQNRGLSVAYASAAEVAQTRQGDCTEFAVLTAALCRAAGIPAQVVVGIAYTQDFAGREGFVGHAWTQAYIGGKWIGLDAALKGTSRGGHDAGHIALSIGNGGSDDFANMASAMGTFTIEKIQVEKRR
jgi:hypothetical protein